MTFKKKQNILTSRLNKYFVHNPSVLMKLPQRVHFIPVDSTDSKYFRYSIRIIKRSQKDKDRNVLLAILTGKDWIFTEKLVA